MGVINSKSIKYSHEVSFLNPLLLPTVRIRNSALLFVFLLAREGIFVYACENTEFIQVLDEYVRADV